MITRSVSSLHTKPLTWPQGQSPWALVPSLFGEEETRSVQKSFLQAATWHEVGLLCWCTCINNQAVGRGWWRCVDDWWCQQRSLETSCSATWIAQRCWQVELDVLTVSGVGLWDQAIFWTHHGRGVNCCFEGCCLVDGSFDWAACV